jgi:TetR/AcrR family acrAB operon transcriptional repressor
VRRRPTDEGASAASEASVSVRSYGNHSRDLILGAAQTLFAERGLHETSMADIARSAGLSRATVFNQFGSKALLLDAITAQSLRAYQELLDRALDDESTPADALIRRLFAQMSRGLEANRAVYREVFGEIRKVSMGLNAEGESPLLRRAAFERLVRLMRRGQARGELAQNRPAETLATAFDSLLAGAVTQWLHAGDGSPLGPLLTDLADVLLEGVAPRPPP